MTEQRELRVSDGDRQAAAERLRAAHDEGRLDFYEYDNRLVQAYSAVTHGDLDRLFADLPRTAVALAPPGRMPAVSASREVAARNAFARLPLVLRILWINYAFVVAVNLTVWMLVSGGGGDVYFWPMWLAVPGVALVGASGIAAAVRTHRQAALER